MQRSSEVLRKEKIQPGGMMNCTFVGAKTDSVRRQQQL
jgi:hypothetical protein